MKKQLIHADHPHEVPQLLAEMSGQAGKLGRRGDIHLTTVHDVLVWQENDSTFAATYKLRTEYPDGRTASQDVACLFTRGRGFGEFYARTCHIEHPWFRGITKRRKGVACLPQHRSREVSR